MVRNIEKHIQVVTQLSGCDGWETRSYFQSTRRQLPVLQLQSFRQPCLIDIGEAQGRMSDGGVFKNSALFRGIMSVSLNILKPTPLPKTGDPCWHEDKYPKIPYVIVADDAFQLSSYLTKP